MVIHWNGKKIKYAIKKKRDDRLCVVRSFLGLPNSDQFMGKIVRWQCFWRPCRLANTKVHYHWHVLGHNSDKHRHVKGAATYFESHLMSAILWLACRHHMGEFHVKHPDIKVSKTTAPEDTIFKRFQESYESLPPCIVSVVQMARKSLTPNGLPNHSCDRSSRMGYSTNAGRHIQKAEGRLSGTLWACCCISRREGFPMTSERIYWGTKVLHATPWCFPPSTIPLERTLYLIKLSMMTDVVPEDVLPSDKREAVDRTAKFIAIFHAPYFLQHLV